LKNWKKKKANKNNYFHEICAKRGHSKMDQQQKGPQKTGHAKVVAP